VLAALLGALPVRADDALMTRFVAHVAGSERVDAQAKSFVAEQWAQRRQQDDPEAFLLEALAVISPDFRAALDAYDQQDYAAAATRMAALAGDADPFIAANAAAFEVKSLVEQEKLEEALQRLDALDGNALAAHTTLAPEMDYIRGFCQLHGLDYDAADRTLQSFLDKYPDAPARLTTTARQMLAELRTRQPDGISDVNDLMVFAGRRLSHGDSGERVQDRQARAVELLKKLIEEAEQREQQQSSGGGGGSSGGRGSQNQPNSPMQQSQLPGGSARDTGNRRPARIARPGEAWGMMPPAEREKVLQALRESFPSRYRQLVEQYYEELAKQP
jgi:tetratricopeptide (TPR) repeat protein